MRGIYRGKVLYNNDPLLLGRVKVEVYPMMIGKETSKSLGDNEGIEIDALPWAVPAMPLFEGAGNDSGCFLVPKVDSYVFVFFENEDPYQPVFFAGAPDGVHGLPAQRTTNYPDRKVWKSKNGVIIELDDTEEEQELKITHPSGTTITINPDGSMDVEAVKDVNVLSAADVNITSTGNINMNP